MTHTIVNPADESVVTTVAAASIDDTDAAIARAAAAQRDWARLAPVDRARLLRRFADAVDGAVDELAAIEMRNSGHPISQARWEAGHVRDVLEYYSASPNDCSAGRSRWPADSTSRSRNRSAWSALSRRGTSR